MFRKISLIVIASLFVFGMSKFSFAMMCGESMQVAQVQDTKKATQETKAINVGNKICPVSGEKINEKTKATYEYKGKIYNFCCPMCIDEFKKNPGKYIKKADEELKASPQGQVKEEQQATQESDMPMGMHEGHQH